MKPKRVICPICGKEMRAISWGKSRKIYRGMGSDLYCGGMTYNNVDYECPCGNKMTYKGTEDCWEHEGCQCKSCVNFQKRYPYHEKGCQCKSCKKWDEDYQPTA